MSDSRDTIQARLLASVDDTYNKSEGEFIYDSLKPVSIELESTYVTIDGLIDKAMLDTATGKNLDRVGKMFGVTRKTAQASIDTVTVSGTVGSAINSGDLVASDSLKFAFIENTTVPSYGSIDVPVQCTTVGSRGNVPVGAIKYFPKTLQGLTNVINTNAFDTGTDTESDDSFRSRIYLKIQEPATSGNVYQYRQWALSVNGIGECRVLSLWNGNGTVKLLLLDNNKQPASTTLVNNVRTYVESVRPIGATVTYVTPAELSINVSVSIQIDSILTNVAQAKTDITTAIKSYLESIAFKQAYISYAKIGALILSCVGITDYSNLTLNSAEANVIIADDQVAVLGGVTLA